MKRTNFYYLLVALLVFLVGFPIIDDFVPGNPFADANGTLGYGVANPALKQDDLHLFNVSVLWTPRDSDLSVSAGVDNLTDEEFTNFGNYQDGFGWTTEIFDRGRQWYVQVSYDF